MQNDDAVRLRSGYSRLATASFIWALVVTLNVYMPLPYTSVDYFWIDTAETVYHTKLLALGRVPYKEIFSHHFLGYLAPFYAWERILGITPSSIWVMAIGSNLLNCVLVYFILKLLGSRRAGYWGALFTATAGWVPQWQGYFFNIQSSVLPFLLGFFLGFLHVRRNPAPIRIYLLGLLYGYIVTTDIRHAVFGLCSASLFFSASLKLSITRLWYFISGAAIIPLLGLIYLWNQGALEHFWFQNFTFPFRYRNFALEEAKDGYLWFLRRGFGLHLNEVLFALVGTIILLVSSWPSDIKFSIASLAVCGVLASAAGGRGFGNYLIYFVPWLTITAPLLAHEGIANRFLSRFGPLLLGTVCGLSIALGPLTKQLRDGALRTRFEPHQNAKKAAAYIQMHTVPTSAILVWSYYPQIYLFSQRFSRWRVLEQLPITGGNFDSTKYSKQGIVPEIVSEFKSCLAQYPPEFIAYFQLRKRKFAKECFRVGGSHRNGEFERRPYLRYFEQFIEENYHLSRTFSTKCDRIRVFRISSKSKLRVRRDDLRNSCTPATPQAVPARLKR